METEEALSKAEASWNGVADKVLGWLDHAVEMLPNLAVAVVVLLLFISLSKLIGSLSRRTLMRTSGSNAQITDLVVTTVRISVLAGGAFVALGVLQLDKTVSSLLAGVGIVGLAIGFALQDLLGNFMSGILLAFRRPFEPGELVFTNGMEGNVREQRLSATLLETFQGQLVWIPNKDVLNNVLTNYTRLGKRRIDLEVGVSYGDDLQKAEDTCRAALAALPFRDESKDVDIWFTGFGSSSIDISARLWIDLSGPVTFLKARSEMIKAIKQAFDEAGLTIPFPIRTLDFGITGGEPLRDHLEVLQLQGGGRNQHPPERASAEARALMAER